MASSSAVLGMLLYETTGLYRSLSETHRKLLESSARDGLTGVFNRAYFDERFAREFAMASSADHPLSVLLVDVDHFKQYNDSFGHLAGDECLKQVAKALSNRLRRQGDFVARYGGEEFVAVLPGCGAQAAEEVGNALRAAVEKLAVASQSGRSAQVTVSIGLACTLTDAPDTAPTLLRLADAALYRAKALGRNRIASSADLKASPPAKLNANGAPLVVKR